MISYGFHMKGLRNTFQKVFILLLLVTTSINADNTSELEYPKYICQDLFREFDISPEIKSSKGWARVKYKNTLGNYILPEKKDKLTENKKNVLMSCLINSSVDLASLEHTIGGR